MNYLKTNPVGKDISIQKLQKALYDALTAQWNADLDGYGRCYTVSTKGVKTIEPYVSNDEYKNLVVAEKNKFFFTAESDDELVGIKTFKTSVNLYFIVDVKNIYPNITHRADEEVRKDVINLINSGYGFIINKVVTNIERVFSRYEFSYEDDLQPYHCFKIELDSVEYNINQSYCIN